MSNAAFIEEFGEDVLVVEPEAAPYYPEDVSGFDQCIDYSSRASKADLKSDKSNHIQLPPTDGEEDVEPLDLAAACHSHITELEEGEVPMSEMYASSGAQLIRFPAMNAVESLSAKNVHQFHLHSPDANANAIDFPCLDTHCNAPPISKMSPKRGLSISSENLFNGSSSSGSATECVATCSGIDGMGHFPSEQSSSSSTSPLICAEQTDSSLDQMSKYTCSLCKQSFKSNIGLCRHEASTHGKEQFPCELCAKNFSSSNGLSDHKKRVHAPRPYVCEFCQQSFATEYYLKAHFKIHDTIRPHQCETCHKTFVNKTDLRNHMRVHTGDRPYRCEVCGKAFRHVSGFYTHVRIHTGETPYKCEFCDKQFTNASNFQTHRKIHTQEKSFKCEYCGREFIQQSNYSRHKRLHTGDKPYKCEVCDKSFMYSTALKKHQSEHGIKAIPCDTCGRTFLNQESFERHRTGCSLKNVVQREAQLDSAQYL